MTTATNQQQSFQPKQRVLAKGAAYSGISGETIPYLADLRELDTSVLTRQQEQHLARQAQEGNTTSREKLIQANLRLVVAIANKWLHQYPQHRSELVDLIQEGNAALIHAIDKFDPSRNIKLSTYATWWIYQAMQTHLQGVHRPYRVPGNALTHLNTLKRAKTDFTETHGKAPTIAQLASILGWSAQKVINLMGIQEHALSIEGYGQDDDPNQGAPLSLTDPSEAIDIAVTRNEEASTLATVWHSELSEKEQDILKRHFGIDLVSTDNNAGQRFTTGTTAPEPLHVIGQRYSVSREAIRKAEKRALNKLKTALTM